MALKFEYNKEERTATVCGVDDKFCEEIVIPATVEYYTKDYKVTRIGKEAFKGCTWLKEVTIGNSVTEIGESAFEGCTGELTVNCNIPSASLCRCGVFYNSKFTKVTIGDSVTEIGAYAFYGCTSLTMVTIGGNSFPSIGFNAFFGCISLKAFYGKFASADNRCLILDGVLKSFASAGLISCTIPDSVASIGNGAFCDCTSLTKVTIPDSVTSIGKSAFKYCTSLTSVTIPNSVTSIGVGAFLCCKSLKEVSIPDSVTEIGTWAFFSCESLKEVTIPDSVTKIGVQAFKDTPNIKVNICNDEGCVEIGRGAFDSTAEINYVGKEWVAPKLKTAMKDNADIKKAKAEAEAAKAEVEAVKAELEALKRAKAEADAQETTDEIASEFAWAETFWTPLKDKLTTMSDIKGSKPADRGYAIYKVKDIDVQIVPWYREKSGEAGVSLETYGGESMKATVESILAKAPANSIARKAELSQGKKNKDKWNWTVLKDDKNDSNIIQWYADTILSFYSLFKS